MKFGVIVFPGSQLRPRRLSRGDRRPRRSQAEYIWHKDTDLKGADVVILPGGFAHGDYLRTGAMARFSPIMREVQAFADARRAGARHLQRLPGSARGGPAAGRDAAEPRAEVPLRARPRPRRADRHAVHVRRAGRARCCGFRSRTAKATTSRRPTCSSGSKRTGRSSSATRRRTGEARRRGEPERVGARDRRPLQRGAQRGRPDAAPGARLRAGARQRRRPRHLRIGRCSRCKIGRAGRARHDRSAGPRTPRPQARRIRAHRRVPRPRAEPDRARHLLGDVVRALQLQELARPPEDAADRRAAGAAGARRERRRRRHRRRLAAVFKIESHNHPSFIEPYQGAATGVGGIIRDIFTMGARPIALMNSLRFGPLDAPGTRASARRRRRRHRRLRQQHRHPDRRRRDRLRAVATPATRWSTCSASASPRPSDIIKGVASGVGNAVYYVGAKTGRDGIHGATMASAEFDDKSAEKRPAVQVGDPFMEKLLLEACLEVMQTDALVGIQDMGAAGLTCSTTEMGSRGGAGVEIDVVARAAARDRHDAVRDHAVRVAGADAARRQAGPRGRGRADLREVGSARRAHRRGHRRRHAAREGSRRGRRRDSEPRADRRSAGLPPADGAPGVPGRRAARSISTRSPTRAVDGDDALLALLGSPTIASKQWAYRQYDHMVQTNTSTCPGSAPASSASRAPIARWRCRSTATAATATSIRSAARCSRWPRPRATSPAPARGRSARPTA